MLRNVLFICFLACMAVVLFLDHRMMMKIRDDSKPVFFRFSLLKALRTSEFYGSIIMLRLAIAFLIAIKITEGYSINDFIPFGQ